MSTLKTAILFAIPLAFLGWTRAAEPVRTKSALETDPTGWLDLTPGKDLKGWKRVALAPDTQLNKKNGWSFDADRKVLVCDGVDVKEMLLYEREFGDGVFHVEWRFKKVDKPGYNSGVYVRSKDDGKVWHQVQVAHQKDAPRLADIFGDTLVDGQVKRVIVNGTGDQHAREPGEWNTYEITCKGKSIGVWLNGVTVTTWDACSLPKGCVGMQAEFFYIEFRNLKFKELK